jgi:zinc ribbon protein
MRLMVGWGFAFGRGIVILLWSIVWAIVAGIIAVLITGGTLTGIISNPTSFASNPTAYIGGFLLGIFLSVFIAVIGLYASIVKVTVDGAISQIEKSGVLERSSYPLGPQPTQTAPPTLRKYCPNCGTSIPGGSLKCPSCGATL